MDLLESELNILEMKGFMAGHEIPTSSAFNKYFSNLS